MRKYCMRSEKKYSNPPSWWFVARVTPFPISNREVKPRRTDDSLFKAKVGSCQDSGFECKAKSTNYIGAFCFAFFIKS